MDQNKTIFLADDHNVLRSAMAQLIEKLGPFSVTGTYENGEEVLVDLKKGLIPDLLILDLQMPIKGGLEVMEEVFSHKIPVSVLILTMDSDESSITKLFRLGARGYLRKDCSADKMREAINEILSKGFYHNEFLFQSLQNNSTAEHKSANEVITALSDREKEFIKLVCHENEFTYEQIADKMCVQFRTVDGYRHSVFAKIGVKSKTGLVLYLLKHRILDRI